MKMFYGILDENMKQRPFCLERGSARSHRTSTQLTAGHYSGHYYFWETVTFRHRAFLKFAYPVKRVGGHRQLAFDKLQAVPRTYA